MGDMADMINQYGEGQEDDHDDSYSPPMKICRCCGVSGLTWGNFGDAQGKWRLIDSTTGDIHTCPVNPLNEGTKPIAKRVPSIDPIETAFRAGFDAGYASCSDQAWPEVGPGGGAPGVSEAWKRYAKEPKSL